MLPLHTHGKASGTFPDVPVKVLDLEEALGDAGQPSERVVVRLPKRIAVDVGALQRLGFRGIVQDTPCNPSLSLPVLHSLTNPSVVGTGDVIQVRPDTGQVSVLYRRRSESNTLFITERCNSLCLMCSQPPREVDDTWRIQHLKTLLELIDRSTKTLGVTGGEPTLLREQLADLLRYCRSVLPDTQIHVLTNGRLFSQRSIVELFDGLQDKVRWGIPLYGDIPNIHDYVVQAENAFYETLDGIYNLAATGHAVELRYVLHLVTKERLRPFAEFVSRNLPFVSHLAFMGLEPEPGKAE